MSAGSPSPAAEPLTVDALLERIRRDGVRRTAAALRKPPVPSRLLQELSERSELPEARQFVAAYPLSPSHLLETLAQAAPDPTVLGLLATNPRTPPHLLTQFAAHPEASVRAQAALHPQIPPRELLTLAADPERSVRRSLASNASLRLPQYAVLAADADAAVRLRVAGHPALPKPAALVLAADASASVRVHAIATARVDEEVLLGWAASDEEEIQLALTRREDLTPAIYQTLILAPFPSVRRAVRDVRPLDEVALLHLATRGETDERAWVAGRDLLARPLQNVLAQDVALEVRTALAANVSLDEEIARYFVGQAEPAVCVALATNPAVPLDLVQELAATRDPDVLAALAYRDVLEAELVHFLLVHSPEFRGHWARQARPLPDLDYETAKKLFSEQLPSVRALAVSGCSQWRLADLYEIARDPAPAVRLAAVRHPRASIDLIAERLHDTAPEVVALAQQLHEARQRAAAEAARLRPAVNSTRSPAPAPASAPPRPVAPSQVGSSAPAPVPPPGLVARSTPGLFNKLKRIFWQ
jgi:hypothetical protein